jgi:hypothetical protein
VLVTSLVLSKGKPILSPMAYLNNRLDSDGLNNDNIIKIIHPEKYMANPKSVPTEMIGTFATITELTDTVCKKHLDAEYADLAKKMAAKLARKRPSPLAKGKSEIWACSIMYALGQINFLFDKTQTPHLEPKELCELFGVKLSTAKNKAGMILDMLKSGPCDPEWFRPSHAGDNPVTWMLQTTEGFVFDVRDAPLEVQEEAFKLGLIPYVPDRGNSQKS